ncbi:MAG: DUF4926 domain-containing protein [Microcystaceae cyanobacterium]
MTYSLYSDCILLTDIPEENLSMGDIGTIVEIHQIEGLETGYSVEFFDLLGKTVAVVTLSQSTLRLPCHNDRPTVRVVNNLAA